MLQLLHYYGQYQGFRDTLGRLPGWARLILLIFAIPGLLALALSIVAVLVSILALLICTVPVLKVLRAVTGVGSTSYGDEFPAEQGLEGPGMDEPADGVEAPETPASQAPTVVVESPSEALPQRPRRQIDVRIVE